MKVRRFLRYYRYGIIASVFKILRARESGWISVNVSELPCNFGEVLWKFPPGNNKSKLRLLTVHH